MCRAETVTSPGGWNDNTRRETRGYIESASKRMLIPSLGFSSGWYGYRKLNTGHQFWYDRRWMFLHKRYSMRDQASVKRRLTHSQIFAFANDFVTSSQLTLFPQWPFRIYVALHRGGIGITTEDRSAQLRGGATVTVVTLTDIKYILIYMWRRWGKMSDCGAGYIFSAALFSWRYTMVQLGDDTHLYNS